MSIYQSRDYRQIIRAEVEFRKGSDRKVTFAFLAQAAGVQNTYLSNVLNERAHLNSDQLFAIAQALEFDEEVTDYILLLLEWDRSEHPLRKPLLAEQIVRRQKAHFKTEKHLSAEVVAPKTEDLAEYYLDPYNQVIHVMLDLEEFAADPQKLCPALGISASHLAQILKNLEKLGYVSRGEGSGLKSHRPNFHLPKDSVLCQPQQLLLRLKALDQIQRVPAEQRHNVSVTFSADHQSFQKIHEHFLEFIKKCEKVVATASAETAYQLNFDLFPWDLR